MTKINRPEERPKRPKWAKELDDREFRFVTEWLVDMSYTGAARRCGFGNTDGSHRTIGYDLAHRPHVARAMDEALIADASGPRQWITSKLRAFADSNMGDFFEWAEDGTCTIKPWKDMPRELTALVKEVRRRKDGEVVMKLHDPIRALEILSKVGAIALTKERVVVEDSAGQLTDDLQLARTLAFLLTKAARKAPSP